MSTQKTAALIGLIVLAGLAVYIYQSYGSFSDQQSARTGTEQLTAEQVVDLEVQAQAEYEAAGGEY